MFSRKLPSRRKLLIWLQIVCLIMVVSYTFHKIGVLDRIRGDTIGGEEYDYQSAEIAAVTLTPFPPVSLRTVIKESNDNANRVVHNEDIHGPLMPNDPVIVVQVHNRIYYLNLLISSLSKVKGIEKALIIFSHDIFNDEINSLVSNIKFCKILQIFYPYSLQAYPNEFPGKDPLDCPRNIDKQKALEIKCNNANHSDSYGHYREAIYTQTKHHWFWKMNHIFDKITITRNHDSHFIFLEEDHFAVPDMLYVLNLMEQFKQSHCNDCDLITLGAYPKVVNYAADSNKVEIREWISSLHNMGMVLDRKIWNKIKNCATKFCQCDDYNWDWSLMHISRECLDKKLMALTIVAPRVFHIGQCGVHHKSRDCFKNELVEKIDAVVQKSTSFLFPSQLKISTSQKKKFKMPKLNGGWGDVRDHALCLNFTLA
ncbi:alpha-1,6-mannosyl-glycoprotein 2-beta-N-acetylglucosaminyltransferase [Brevipalpus obovatus]|uniref:alpha-1,6-mannosyl-glycoprotein 2-beta-N-acetylglucosaminyltransferase n=1 Tax=Brevipalpus obovatus TaxID=246614 RepID=UPI003D9F1E96